MSPSPDRRRRSQSTSVGERRESNQGTPAAEAQPEPARPVPTLTRQEPSDLRDEEACLPPGPRDVHNPGNSPDWYEHFKKHAKGPWGHASSVDWHEKWDENSFSNGRVLIIDYCKPDSSTANRTRISAVEIASVHALHKYYMTRARKPTALRLVHVQNAPWAVQYLLRKYNVDGGDELTNMNFAKWAKYSRPEWRAGKPLLKGKTWRTQRDPWRGVRRTAFGLDYVKCRDARAEDNASSHEANSIAARGAGARGTEDNFKMMELNCYDDADAPVYGWDIDVQRLSVYIQYKEPGAVPPEDVESPYADPVNWKEKEAGEKKQTNGRADGPHKKGTPPLKALDNGNTIIVFENSHSGSVSDTLIGARQEIESRWRRLSFYLPPKDLADESRLALECMELILREVFKGITAGWDHLLGIAETHVSILEDKIYTSPADESRAPELWYNSSSWLKVERLAYIHLECVKELIPQLGELHAPEEEVGKSWLDGTVDQFDRITVQVEEELVKPTANLSDLMYKSVGIRDSRQSLGLSSSMWRLSWITFIFLPLTFTVGFFGMNVNIFANDPSIKWFFVACVPMLVIVLLLWYVLKHALAAQHQTPYQRGVYEHMFHDLAVEHPDLWSRSGPRPHVQPTGWWDSIRWWLLRRWFDPRRTIAQPHADPDEDVGGSGLGAWARTKRLLARRWLGTIKATRRASTSESEVGLVDVNAMDALVAASTPVLAAEVPDVRRVTRQNLERLSPPPPRNRSGSPRTSQRRSSGGGDSSSGMMVDERDVDDQLDAGSLFDRTLRQSIDGVMYNHRVA